MSGSDRRVATDLWDLTEVLVGAGFETTGGFLGGEFGYGAFFENDVFMMHPFCWCERADCPWCRGCECVVEDLGEHIADWSARWHTVSVCVNCAPGEEPNREPNFRHKPSGTEATWYKYIGRSMEVDIQGDWREIFRECMESARTARPTSEVTE